MLICCHPKYVLTDFGIFLPYRLSDLCLVVFPHIIKLSCFQDEFAAYEANDPFSQTLMVQMDGLLGSFVPLLTEENYRALVAVLVAEVAQQLEKAIFKATFNRASC